MDIAALQECFEGTDWHMFKEAVAQENYMNIEEFKHTVTSYIS